MAELLRRSSSAMNWVMRSGRSDMHSHVFFERGFCAAADFRMARGLVVAQTVTHGVIECGEKIEGDVGGLIVLRIGRRDVVAQRAERGLAWQGGDALIGGKRKGEPPGEKACGDGLDVALDTGDLPREEDAWIGTKLQGGIEQRGRVDIGVAMDLAVAQELRVLKTRNHAEDALLFAELEVVLEADEVVAVSAQILHAQLNAGVGSPSG